MSIQTKKIVVNDKTYKMVQHPATEGCLLIEEYYLALVAFAQNQETRVIHNTSLAPFIAMFDGDILALFMFIDRLAAPDVPYSPYVRDSSVATGALTIREIKAGSTLADRAEVVEEWTPTPLGYAFKYAATDKQAASIDLDSIFEQFFRYITFDGEPLDVNTLSYKELAQLLQEWMSFNMLHLWNRERWTLPDNYGGGGIQPPKSLKGIRGNYSQSNIIYTILNSTQHLATHAELSTVLSVSDAYDMNETALLKYYEDTEMQKEAERQAKNNH